MAAPRLPAYKPFHFTSCSFRHGLMVRFTRFEMFSGFSLCSPGNTQPLAGEPLCSCQGFAMDSTGSINGIWGNAVRCLSVTNDAIYDGSADVNAPVFKIRPIQCDGFRGTKTAEERERHQKLRVEVCVRISGVQLRLQAVAVLLGVGVLDGAVIEDVENRLHLAQSVMRSCRSFFRLGKVTTPCQGFTVNAPLPRASVAMA